MIIVFRTEPFLTKSRRFQLRCVLEMPIQVQKGEDITGELRLKSHSRQSYDVHLQLTGPAALLCRLSFWFRALVGFFRKMRLHARAQALRWLRWCRCILCLRTAISCGLTNLWTGCLQGRRSRLATRRRRCDACVLVAASNARHPVSRSAWPHHATGDSGALCVLAQQLRSDSRKARTGATAFVGSFNCLNAADRAFLC